MSNLGTGWCASCGLPYNLNRDGGMRGHRLAGTVTPCPGSGRPPKEDSRISGMLVQVRRIHESVKLPRYQTAGAAGMDLHAAIPAALHIYPRQVQRVGIGLAFAIPSGFEGQIRPRSGLGSKGLTTILGTIDSDYRGEVSALLVNVGQRVHVVRPGDRIAQLVIAPVARADLVEVKELPPTTRGDGGFGSTGGVHGS